MTIFLICKMEKILLPKVVVKIWWDSVPEPLVTWQVSFSGTVSSLPSTLLPSWAWEGLDKSWMCLYVLKLPWVRRLDTASELCWCSVLSHSGETRETGGRTWHGVLKQKDFQLRCVKNSSDYSSGRTGFFYYDAVDLSGKCFLKKTWLQFRARCHVCFLVLCLLSEIRKWQAVHSL